VGAGRFYVGDYAIASMKLCLPLIVCILAGIAGCILNEEDDDESTEDSSDDFFSRHFKRFSAFNAKGITAAIASCGCCAWQIWWMVDWILFAMNEIPDAEGRTLYPM